MLLEMTEKSLGIAGVVDRAGHWWARFPMATCAAMRPAHRLRRGRDDPHPAHRARRRAEKRWRSCRKKVSALFVVEAGQSDLPIGVLHLHDLGRLGS
jgi:arabinose-5-phosphate isomerase